ncbi:MAG: hypothetical protein K9M80_09095, partial [Candidatus Marinimicrobia bacterium]|nr:hypothetical protein [Candidatus Neomarinimicrobiota bacterium]
MKNKINIIVLILVLVTMLQADQKEKLRLLEAGKLQQYTEQGGVVKKLTNDIHFRKGDVDLRCELAFWYEQKERADFFKNVIVTNKARTLTADSLIYFYDRDIIRAFGNPALEDSSGKITADTLIYHIEDELFYCKGDVKLTQENKNLTAKNLTYMADIKKTIATQDAIMENKENLTTLASDSIVYFNEANRISAYINPVLTKIDTASSRKTKIFGSRIKGTEKEGNFTVLQNVKIIRDEMKAFADHADYNDSTGVITLTGNPNVISDNRDIYGDKITAYLRDNKIKHVNIDGNAIASSVSHYYLPAHDSTQTKSDTSHTPQGDLVNIKDEMTGNQMDIYFKNGNTDSIRVSGMATSYYNVAQDSILKGVNQASGDTIVMHFDSTEQEQSKLHKITVVGGTEGKFIPHRTNTEMDTSIIYSAGKIQYFIENRETWLRQKANTKYKDMQLSSGKIQVLWKKNLLYAT